MNVISSLKIKLLQAPIGSCCTPQLAASVSNSGGLGALAVTWHTPRQVREAIETTKKLTSLAFQSNFVLCFPIKEQLRCAIESRTPVITFSWGMPSSQMVNDILQAKIPFGIQVFTEAEAREAEDLGADFLITQGVEAGGHVQGNLPLIKQIERLKLVDIGLPLVAAGGIGTPEDALKVLSSGADAVMLGTRFVASSESAAHDEYKNLLVQASGADTAFTECFSIGWPDAPHRVLRNSVLDLWEQKLELPEHSGAFASDGSPVRLLSDMPPTHGVTGSIKNMCLYAGTSVSGIDRIATASEIMEEFRSKMI